jgi:succinate-semialdehyde dehydrogenase / glutarate-semialdehyde dehydrogenase
MTQRLPKKLLEQPHELLMLIGGEAVSSVSAATFDLHSPATGEVVGVLPEANIDDVNAAVTAAQSAFESWSKLTAYQREAIVRKATAHVRTQADRIGMLMALEQGKPFNQSRSEIIGSCDTLDYYAAEGVRLEGYSNPTEAGNLRSSVSYSPVGVCALITPWNYPVSLLSWKLGPALAAGCTSVVKSSPVTPMSPLEFCRALETGGLPKGVVNVVTGSGASLGAALVTHIDVVKVAMTGSTATGKKILESVASQLKKVSLELGGHAPAIVCADADVENAAKIVAYKGFRNMGQSCSSVNRCYVHSGVFDQFVASLKVQAEKLSIGDGVTDGAIDLGPMATREALEKVETHVKDALARGSTLVTGGIRPSGFSSGNYYTPTVLTNVPNDALMMREETFGPVVPVVSFDDLGEAIQLANDTEYGLVAYLFAKDYATITKVSDALEAGTVCVNNGGVNTNYAPYEGWKNSGFGVELGRRGILEYVKTKHVKVQF